ncbi:Uncharacterized protein DBV15_12622 [Temnothorax longispinosus]|uniref:Uncharacterized protein n=1 Tax=Temnothorax longispinosus TaxID=300112 RepID=A0A4S2KWH8_9HYME|nr:Uncharacterized protein DBV15_12622 [Temnothorax longispinosus]
MLLKRIADSESLSDIKETDEILSNVKLDEIISADLKMMEYKKLEKLIKELSDNITDKTDHEKKLFNEINKIINCAGTQSENIKTDYIRGFRLLGAIRAISFCHDIRGIKCFADTTLKNMTLKIKPNSFKEIAKLFTEIYRSIEPRIRYDNLDKLIYEIFFIFLNLEQVTSNGLRN